MRCGLMRLSSHLPGLDVSAAIDCVRGLLFLPRNPRSVAKLPGNHPGDLLRQAVRLRPIRRARHAVVLNHRLLRQAPRRGHRGHGSIPGGSRARHRCGLAAMAQHYGVQPQVMPRMIGLGLYRFDINFRESAVVGIVGGGGIGATLNTAFDRYEFDSAAAILLIIIAIVMLMEYSSGYLRRWVQ